MRMWWWCNMAITIRGEAIATEQPVDSTSITVMLPTPRQPGDVVLVFLVAWAPDENENFWTLPDETWEQPYGSQMGPSGFGDYIVQVSTMYHVVTELETNQSVLFECDYGTILYAVSVCYSGVSVYDVSVQGEAPETDGVNFTISPTVENTKFVVFTTLTTGSEAEFITNEVGGYTERIQNKTLIVGSSVYLSYALWDLDRTPDEASPTYTFRGLGDVNWCYQGIVLRASAGEAVFADTYKSKLMRQLLPPPYEASLKSNIGKIVSILGASDNEIGGLYGDADFLPDETP